MVDRKAKTFGKYANYAVNSNRLRDRMDICEDADYLLDMKLSSLHMKRNRGVVNTKDDRDESDLFDENYLTYLLGLENSVKQKPIKEDEPDPDYLFFLEYLEEHGKPYKLDVPVEHGVSIEEDVSDPQYLTFLENLKVHGNSYMVDVPLKHGVPLRIMYETENVHFDDVMTREIPKHGCEYNIHKERYNAKKTNRRLNGVYTTHIKRHRESTKRKFLCSSSDEYFQGERNIAEKNDRRNVSSYGVRNIPKKRTRGDSRRENSHFTSHIHVQEKRSNFLKNKTKNVRIYELSDTEERPQCENMNSENSCSSSDSYAQAESKIARKNNRRNVRSYGVSNSPKKKTRGESTVRKFSHSTSHVNVQEKGNIALKNNKRKVGSYGVNSAKKARTCGKGMMRNNSCSLANGCYVQDVRILDSSEAKDSDFNKRMAESLDENVKEKRTVGEVIKKRKLKSHTGDHIQEDGNLNVSNGKKFGVEGSGSRKDLVPVTFKFDHFQCKETAEKNNPISVSFADHQDKGRTEKKNPIPLNVDYFTEERTVGEVIKKRKLMSHTGSHIQEERILNASNGKKTGVEGSGTSKKITKLQSSDHFQGKQTTEKNNPISVSFADFEDKERTEKKNPIPLNLDCFKKDQCVNVIVNSRSAPKKSTFQKSVINDVYDLFLKNLEVIGESVVYKFGDNERVLYELSSERCLKIVADSSNPPIKRDQTIKNNVRTSIAAESRDQSMCKIVAGLPLTVQVATEKQPTHPSTSAIPASRSTKPLLDKQLYNSLEAPHMAHRVADNMRKRLLVILSRPYDKQEHERLWKEVSFRSAVLSHRDSRSGGSHRPGQMGRSLLDWHPDLNSEIDKVKSEPLKVLNLLRMFSFYIEKLPCGNICMPWLDDSLMTIVHGSA